MLTLAVPAAEAPRKVTKQLPVASSEHVVELRDPPVVPRPSVKVTNPVGTSRAVTVSTTVAVQIDVCPVLIVAGLQRTDVEVLSTGALTAIVAETVLALAL